jgi:hypothetical protein
MKACPQAAADFEKAANLKPTHGLSFTTRQLVFKWTVHILLAVIPKRLSR